MKINDKVFEEFPILKTQRLKLREIRVDDAKQIFEMRSSGRVNEFIPRNNMMQEEDALQLAEKTIQAFKNKQAIGWAGILRDNNEIIGTCGFNQIDFYNIRAEIGGEMATEFWGKNIAFEAVQVIINFGFEELNLHAIEAKVSPENIGAINVLTQIGFLKEAHYKDRIYFNNQFSDMAVYTLFKGNQKFSNS